MVRVNQRNFHTECNTWKYFVKSVFFGQQWPKIIQNCNSNSSEVKKKWFHETFSWKLIEFFHRNLFEGNFWWLWSWPTSWRKSTSNVGTRASRPNSLEDFIDVAHIFLWDLDYERWSRSWRRSSHLGISQFPMTQGHQGNATSKCHCGILLRTRTYHLRNDKVWISSTGKIFSWNRIFLFLWKYFVKSFLNTIQ